MTNLACRRIEELLPWYLRESLSAEDRAAVEQHLATCTACRAALAETSSVGDLFAAHVPAEVLVDYAEGQPTGQVSRQTLEAHLAHCAECRGDLALLQGEGPPSRQVRPEFGRTDRRLVGPLLLAATLAGAAAGLSVWWVMRQGGPAATGRVALVELTPAGSVTRGAADSISKVNAAIDSALLLTHDRGERFDELRARVVDSGSGKLVWQASRLLEGPAGGATLLLPAHTLSAGAFEIELEGRLGGEWSRLAVYRLELERPSSGTG